jgi:hypothetical protein
MRRRSRPVIIAFAVSPLAASVASAAWVFVLDEFLGGLHNEFSAGANMAIMFVVSLLVAYLAAAVIGAPGYLLFRRIGWVRRRHWFLLGAAIGCAPVGLIMAMGILASGQAWEPSVFVIIGAVLFTSPPALVMGVVFAWLIRRAEPNIDRIAATFD